MGKHDWSGVDWTHTNAEIAASLGIRSVESVARKRRALGMPAVYPPTPTERIQALEAERDVLRAKAARAKELALRLLGILRSHDCEDGGFVPGEMLIIARSENELQGKVDRA